MRLTLFLHLFFVSAWVSCVAVEGIFRAFGRQHSGHAERPRRRADRPRNGAAGQSIASCSEPSRMAADSRAETASGFDNRIEALAGGSGCDCRTRRSPASALPSRDAGRSSRRSTSSPARLRHSSSRNAAHSWRAATETARAAALDRIAAAVLIQVHHDEACRLSLPSDVSSRRRHGCRP